MSKIGASPWSLPWRPCLSLAEGSGRLLCVWVRPRPPVSVGLLSPCSCKLHSDIFRKRNGLKNIHTGLWASWSWRIYQRDVCSHFDVENVIDGDGASSVSSAYGTATNGCISHLWPPVALSVPVDSHHPIHFITYHLMGIVIGFAFHVCVVFIRHTTEGSSPCPAGSEPSGVFTHVSGRDGFLKHVSVCGCAQSSQSTRWSLLTFTFFRKEEAYLGPINSAR